MIRVHKLDFQGEDLFLHYSKDGDYESHVGGRIIVVAWRRIPAIVSILTRLFEIVANKCLPSDGSHDINWDAFVDELKKYEESIGKGKNKPKRD